MKQIILSSLFMAVLSTVPVFPAEPKSPPRVSALDFSFSGISEAEVREYTDALSSRIRQAGKYRVIDRKERISLLQRSGFQESERRDEEYQLSIARIISADFIIVGSIRKSRSSYDLSLKVIDVETGIEVHKSSGSYPSRRMLFSDGRRVSSVLISEIGKATRRKRVRSDSERIGFSKGFKIGQESVTRTSSTDGGSYFYLELLTALYNPKGPALSIDAKYSVGFFPTFFENHLISILMNFSFKPFPDFAYSYLGLSYLLSTDYADNYSHHFGAKLCLLSTPPIPDVMDGIIIEILPVSFYYDFARRELVFMLELISLGLVF